MSGIVLIQYRFKKSDREIEQKLFTRVEESCDTKIKYINVWDKRLNWSKPNSFLKNTSALILGGSGDLYFDGDGRHKESKKIFDEAAMNAKSLISHVLDSDFPTLGICFGHQVLGSHIGTRIRHDKRQAKVGSHKINLTTRGKQDALFSEMPDSFHAQYGHSDSLSSIPNGATLLAKANNCKRAAYRYRNNVYGVQFHPELTMKDTEERMAARKYLTEEIDAAQELKSSPEASYLLERFINHYIK